MTVIDGNFGEFFGAIAVVATLGYLVVQIAAGEQYLASWDRPFCSEFYDIWMNEIFKSKEVGKHKQPS